jgi:peptide deformylase
MSQSCVYEEPELVTGMYAAMKAAGGVGLSAVQVGELKRLVVLDVGEGMEVYYNPVITELGGKPEPKLEGCLSTPGFFGTVHRYPTVFVTHGFGKMRCTTVECNGMRAHALQHEIDHLDGEMFTDLLKSSEKSRAFGEMMKLKRSGFKKEIFR